VNRIHLLPEHVANQIAAGEVVERPASVVKELVENALDAGAHHITVVVKNGGRSGVQVTDDGCGMSRDDALLALERHATSKISCAEDLQKIQSLGFRGEAIPSIAAVSRFALTTRERGTLSGTAIEMAGGRIVSVNDVGTAEGTIVEVRNLFFNLPVRRKFLRSEQTEMAHIEHIVTLCALAHAQVAFRLVADQRDVFHLAPTANLLDRMRELFGGQLCEQLVPVGDCRSDIPVAIRSGQSRGSETCEAKCPSYIRVHGYVGKPGVSRADRSRQHVFVNGRPVESRGVNYALLEAYHTALMKGQFPISCLFIELDPALVDVNVHPTKREVRFRDEFVVRQCVIDAVRGALEPKGSTPRPLPVSSVEAAVPAALPVIPTVTAAGDGGRYTLPLQGEGVFAPPQEVQTEEGAWRILGVINQLYVIAESPEGMVLIDQHAAHERVLFEKMLKQLATDTAPSQKLLLPVTLELDARDAVFLRGNLATLHKLGIGLNEFGDKTFLVDALPPYFPLANLPQIFRNILDELRQTGEQIHARRLTEDKIATAVCRHAVKARDLLKGEELRALLEQLHHCDLPYTCPHGRPTMIQISYAELEKKFGRKV
jgi:DNA mismatch repair protein MutL